MKLVFQCNITYNNAYTYSGDRLWWGFTDIKISIYPADGQAFHESSLL